MENSLEDAFVQLVDSDLVICADGKLSMNSDLFSRKSNALDGKVIAASGVLYYLADSVQAMHPERERLVQLIEVNGGSYASNMSGKVNYLICNNTAKRTAKVRFAKDNQIPIISDRKLIDMIVKAKK